MSTEEEQVKKTKIFEILTRDSDTISKERAERIATAVDTSFQKKVLDCKGAIQKLEDQREKLLDMSSSNETTTRNAVDDLAADGFVDKICELDLEIFLAERELEVMMDTKKRLIG